MYVQYRQLILNKDQLESASLWWNYFKPAVTLEEIDGNKLFHQMKKIFTKTTSIGRIIFLRPNK